MSNFILVTGTEFVNQGAYLMLRAAIEQVRDRFNATPVVTYRIGTELERRHAGVSRLIPQKLSRPVSVLGKGRSFKGALEHLPMVLPQDINAVFDASGFAYGDQWVERSLGQMAGALEGWKRRGVPVYMLAQAFGPFKKTESPSKRALSSARIVFARDPESFDHAETLIGDANGETELRLAPDFTLELKGRLPREARGYSGAALVVPNWNIYSRASADDAESYIANLTRLVSALRDSGQAVVGLAHETRNDSRVLELLNARLPERVEIAGGLSGLEQKALISAAPLIVSGRFHAIVSALSQGVPAIMHGWSHKYRHLAREFGVAELLADPFESPANGDRLVSMAVGNVELRAQLAKSTQEARARSLGMWETIYDDLASVGYRAH